MVEPAAVIRVDAVVRTTPAGRLLDPGVGCWTDPDHGWLAQLGTRSAYTLIEYGGQQPITAGSAGAVNALGAWNHIVLTCDGTGPTTVLTLDVNGKRVAHGVGSESSALFDRFGLFAASQAGATLEVRSISATTH